MKTYTKKEVEELFNEFADNYGRNSYKEFLKAKGITGLEVGKWYKHKGNTFSDETSLFCMTSTSESGAVYGYGFNERGEWLVEECHNSDTCMSNSVSKKYLVEVIHEEVEEALIREAKKRYKIGDRFLCLEHGTISSVCQLEDWSNIGNNENTLWNDGGEEMVSKEHDNALMFKNGKWATIIDEAKEMTVEEISKKLGYEIKVVKS